MGRLSSSSTRHDGRGKSVRSATTMVERADPDRYGAAIATTAAATLGAIAFGAGVNEALGTDKALQFFAGTSTAVFTMYEAAGVRIAVNHPMIHRPHDHMIQIWYMHVERLNKSFRVHRNAVVPTDEFPTPLLFMPAVVVHDLVSLLRRLKR